MLRLQFTLQQSPRFRVQAAGGFIQDVEIFFRQQAGGQPQFLGHALGVGAHRLVERADGEFQCFEHLANPRFVIVAAMQFAGVAQKIASRQEIRRHEPFREKGDAAARRSLAVRRAEDFDAAAADITEIERAFDQRGFAGAVFADQSEKFAGGDFQRQVGERDGAGVGFCELADAQCGSGHAA